MIIKCMVRGLNIYQFVCTQKRQPVRIEDVQKQFKISYSSCYNYLITLVAIGLLIKDSNCFFKNNKYRLIKK